MMSFNLMKIFAILFLVVLAGTVQAQDQYTFVFLNKKPDAAQISDEQRKKIMEGHMNNINRLAKEGKLLAAGPFEGGGGLFILKTNSTEEAMNWLSTDPGVQAKRWDIEVFPYLPRLGGVCLVGEKYEMTNYTFVRFTPIVDKNTTSNYPELLKKHDRYITENIARDSVVTEAVFGERDGGILILKGEIQHEILHRDPSVQEGLLTVDIKKLFIAKGSFCEK